MLAMVALCEGVSRYRAPSRRPVPIAGGTTPSRRLTGSATRRVLGCPASMPIAQPIAQSVGVVASDGGVEVQRT